MFTERSLIKCVSVAAEWSHREGLWVGGGKLEVRATCTEWAGWCR